MWTWISIVTGKKIGACVAKQFSVYPKIFGHGGKIRNMLSKGGILLIFETAVSNERFGTVTVTEREQHYN